MTNIQRTTLAIFLALILVGFQNCGGLESNGFAVHESGGVATFDFHDKAFFQYPYKSTPEFYADLQVIALADTGTMHNFKVIGAAAAADGSQISINYAIEIRDAEGVALCPQIAGTLAPSYTTISGVCVSRQSLAGAKARLVLTAGSKSATVERPY